LKLALSRPCGRLIAAAIDLDAAKANRPTERPLALASIDADALSSHASLPADRRSRRMDRSPRRGPRRAPRPPIARAASATQLLKLAHAVVTHTHMDHFIGFDQLLRVALRREEPLAITGPPGFLASVRGRIARIPGT
jgi:hypothetical protein